MSCGNTRPLGVGGGTSLCRMIFRPLWMETDKGNLVVSKLEMIRFTRLW